MWSMQCYLQFLFLLRPRCEFYGNYGDIHRYIFTAICIEIISVLHVVHIRRKTITRKKCGFIFLLYDFLNFILKNIQKKCCLSTQENKWLFEWGAIEKRHNTNSETLGMRTFFFPPFKFNFLENH